MEQKPLVISKLEKRYGNHIVLSDFSLDVHKGECVVLEGPNGVGKSTLLSCVCGNTIADAGSISIASFDINRHPIEARKCLRFVAQEPEIPIGLTGHEILEFYAKVFLASDQLETARSFTQLGEALDRVASTYSFGMRKRLTIACQSFGEAKLYLFDEVFAGLDLPSIENIITWLLGLQSRGCGLLFAAHSQEFSTLLPLHPRQLQLS